MANEKKRINRTIKFRVTIEAEGRLKTAAIERGLSLSEMLRQVVDEHLAAKELGDQKSYIQKFVADAVEEKLKPVENRIAKINAKTATAAAMSMYVGAELLGLNHKDVALIFRRARQKAIEFIRMGIPTTDQLIAWGINTNEDGEEQ